MISFPVHISERAADKDSNGLACGNHESPSERSQLCLSSRSQLPSGIESRQTRGRTRRWSGRRTTGGQTPHPSSEIIGVMAPTSTAKTNFATPHISHGKLKAIIILVV